MPNSQTLVQCLDALPGPSDAPITLLFSNSAYAPLLWNWLSAPGTRDLKRLLVICLDDELRERLHRHGIPTLLMPCERLDHLWTLRMALIHVLLERGHDVLHSDSDAVWMQDPIPLVTAIDADLVMSQGTIHPPDVLAAWGMVCCNGFFLAKGTPRNAHLFATIAADSTVSGSDQASLNRALLKLGVGWAPAVDEYRLHLRGKDFVCSRPVRAGQGRHIRVALLPHHAFQRLPMPGEAAIVMHPLCPKIAGAKLTQMAQAGCLFRTEEPVVAGA